MAICNRLSLAALFCVLLSSQLARAQVEDQAAARSLFDEGRNLMKAGQYADACPKLEAAGKLYPSAGILLNLGDCYEKIGRTASAWTEFGESAAAADRANRHAQAAESRRRQSAVEPKLARLTIRVSHEVAGLTVTRDGSDLAPAAWGEAIPVDPGPHTIGAQAAGHEPWTTSVSVSTRGQTISVDIPELAAVAASPPPPTTAVHEGDTRPTASEGALAEAPAPVRPSRALGFVLLGSGAVVGVGGGVLMGVEAGRASSARSNNTKANNATSIDQYNSTKMPYYLGVAAAVAGGVAAAVGIVLIATARGGADQTTGVRATPWMSAAGGGLDLAGAW